MSVTNQTQDFVFGLDIGTRNIVGTVGYQGEDGFHVIAQCNREHQTRAMLDGQIHDIGRVGETIKEVKDVLEGMIEAPLTQVCIAAAGRVLQTITTRVAYEYPEETVVSGEDLHTLDLMGIDQAQQELKGQEDNKYKFYCVGYSTMRYYLNGELFSSLEGHKAETIEEDIIVTFLPEDVVDGLYSAVERAGLQVANLTLEPIAAINVAIPENFRMLNIALVDVGAGTSDICITRDGSIIAYGMIPLAGDELTEVIVQEYLVDFATAEKIKLDSSSLEEVEYEDIMGIPHKIKAKDVWELTESVREKMTTEVAAKIKELNGGKSVSAAFVVGGGGKIHGYTESLAKKLDIVPERVALRGEEVMKNITFEQQDVKKDPLLVTPIGICLNYYEQKNNFIMVHFNGEMMKLYDNGHLTIVDAAMQAGFTTEELFPRRGREIHFTVNGTPRMARGAEGESAIVRMNDVLVGMNTPLEFNCFIEIEPSTTGEEAVFTIEELDEFANSNVAFEVNGKRIVCPKFVEVNGSLEMGSYQIQEGDAVETRNFYTVGQLAEFMDVEVDQDYDILVNNRPATFDTLIYENFTIDWKVLGYGAGQDVTAAGPVTDGPVFSEISAEEETSGDVAEAEDIAGTAPEEAREPEGMEEQEETVEETEPGIHVTVNGETVFMTGKKDYIFVDIFNVIDFDIHASAGRPVVTKINGERCSYTAALHENDVVDVYWEEA
ncbi:MAG: cell division FtsA domain-containing protein [Lachnospiraceae bacterium]|nr:cell division FtsA domain-containing protein [Lachnospiraceae bacterium]